MVIWIGQNSMVSGSYKDLFVLKAKFSSFNSIGAFLFFSIIPLFFTREFICVSSRSFTVADIKTTLDWRTFERNIDEVRSEGGMMFWAITLGRAGQILYHAGRFRK